MFTSKRFAVSRTCVLAAADQLATVLRRVLPAIVSACTNVDGSEIKIGSFVQTTQRRGVMTDGLADRRAALRSLVRTSRKCRRNDDQPRHRSVVNFCVSRAGKFC